MTNSDRFNALMYFAVLVVVNIIWGISTQAKIIEVCGTEAAP